MGIFKKYNDFKKRENPNGYWFMNKTIGWGWTPVRWQGWVVVLVWIIVFTFGIMMMDHEAMKNGVFLIIFTAILFYIIYKKGEKFSWKWDKSEEENKK